MAHARLTRLRLKGFRSFVTEAVIDFPKEGMVLLVGNSGTGKSSVLLAVAYLLGFCPYPATALQSWYTEEPMEVTGTFDIGDIEVVFTRGTKRRELTINGKVFEGSAEQIERKLAEQLGLPVDLLAALTYRGQGVPGLFLAKTDSGKKEFLTTLLGLERFERAVEQSQKKVRDLESEVHAHDVVVDRLQKDLERFSKAWKQAELVSEEGVRLELDGVEADAERLRTRVMDLRVKIRDGEAAIERRAQQMKRDFQPRLDELTARIEAAKQQELDYSRIDTSKFDQATTDLAQAEEFLRQALAEDEVRQCEQRARSDSVYARLMLLERKLASKTSTEKRLSELQAELEKLGRDVCPTCEQPWNEAVNEERAVQEEISGCRAVLLELEQVSTQVAAVQREFQELGQFVPSPAVEELKVIVQALKTSVAQEQARIEGEVRLLESERDRSAIAAQEELQRARAGIAAEIERYRNNAAISLTSTQEELEELERKLTMAEGSVRAAQGRLSRIQIDNAREEERARMEQRRYQETEQQLLAAQELLNADKTKLNAELDFQQLVGREGFLGAIFDEVLSEISDETNRLLACFPNTSHVTLHFRSETESQKGTISKSIVPVVTVNGHEAPLKSGLSGGMRTAAELAVDLAVAAVVSRRTGSAPGWLILDESFDGLGSMEKEACMEILRVHASDKLILIVDHASEFKEMFTQYIRIGYQGGISTIA